MREKPLLHHFSSSFLPENQNRSEGRSCGSLCCPGRKRFRFPARFTKGTGPALIHNQLVDRSLQTNVCHETSAINFETVIRAFLPLFSWLRPRASVPDSCPQNPPQDAIPERCST